MKSHYIKWFKVCNIKHISLIVKYQQNNSCLETMTVEYSHNKSWNVEYQHKSP